MSSKISVLSPDPLRNKRNLWTSHQRLFLLLCRRLYTWTWSEITQIFNVAFRCDLAAQGFGDDECISEKTIIAQWREIIVFKRREYQAVHVNTKLCDLQKQFHLINANLASVAWSVGVTISTRSFEDTAQVEKITSRQKQLAATRASDCQTDEESDSDSSISDLGMTPPSSPKFQRSCFPTPPITPRRARYGDGAAIRTPKAQKEKEGEILIATETPAYNGLPCLFFRAFNEMNQGINGITGFRAGICGEEDYETTIAPDEESETFLHLAERHYRRDQFPSPFISVTQSLIHAINIAYDTAKRSSIPVQIAIIDGRDAARHNRLYHSAPVYERLKADGRYSPRTKGAFEYLAWHQISKTAIIGVVSLNQLHKLALDQPSVARVLRLHEFKGKRRPTTNIRQSMIPTPIDHHLAVTVSRIAHLFDSSATQHHPWVEDFAKVIIQNFRLQIGGCARLDLMGMLQEAFHNLRRHTFQSVLITQPFQKRQQTPVQALEETKAEIKLELEDSSAEDEMDMSSPDSLHNLWLRSPYE